MTSMFRSEEMKLCQLYLQTESAYRCVSELGEVVSFFIKLFQFDACIFLVLLKPHFLLKYGSNVLTSILQCKFIHSFLVYLASEQLVRSL